MKKYIAPSVEYFNVKNENILAGSIDSVQGEYNGETPLKAREGYTDFNDFDFEEEN